jgi:drug/metabolite transporter (DMT)-like permease
MVMPRLAREDRIGPLAPEAGWEKSVSRNIGISRLRSRPHTYRSGVFLVILATVGSSFSGMFVRMLPELDGWQINCWRSFWVSTSLLIYLTFRYGPTIGDAFRKILRPALLAVALFFVVGSTAYVTSLTLASVTDVAALVALSPVFTALLSRPVTGERVNAATWIATLVALAGVALVMNEGFTDGHGIGNLLALFVALTFAGQTVLLRRFHELDMVPAICIGGVLVFMVAGLFGGGFNISAESMLILALMGSLQLGIPLILFVRSAATVPAVTLSLIVLLDIILNPLWAWIGSGEVPTLEASAGAGIIVAAVVLSILGGKWMISRRIL